MERLIGIAVFLVLMAIFTALAFGAGSLDAIGPNAVVTGCAVENPSVADSVWIYEGVKGSGGKLLTIVRAGISGPGVNCPDNHRFTYTLPDSFKNGQPHTIYAYRGGVEQLQPPQTYNSNPNVLPPGILAQIPVAPNQTLCLLTYLRPTDAVGSFWADVPPCPTMVNVPLFVLTYPNGTTPCAERVMNGALFDIWTQQTILCKHP